MPFDSFATGNRIAGVGLGSDGSGESGSGCWMVSGGGVGWRSPGCATHGPEWGGDLKTAWVAASASTARIHSPSSTSSSSNTCFNSRTSDDSGVAASVAGTAVSISSSADGAGTGNVNGTLICNGALLFSVAALGGIISTSVGAGAAGGWISPETWVDFGTDTGAYLGVGVGKLAGGFGSITALLLLMFRVLLRRGKGGGSGYETLGTIGIDIAGGLGSIFGAFFTG